MTNSAHTTHSPASALGLWTALRTRIQEGAEHRQLRRDLAPFSIGLNGATPGNNAVAREIRAMLHV